VAGIYIHIPFCHSKCAYCNFYSIVTAQPQKTVIESITKELSLQRDFLQGEVIETIYFGGGTPSMLPVSWLFEILDAIFKNYSVTENSEITIEVNPDDVSPSYLKLLSARFNRISIGIQSFNAHDLILLGRKHHVEQAQRAFADAREAGFNNISMDFIYGISENDQLWQQNLDIALSLNPEHLSAYALTVEEQSILQRKIQQKKQKNISDAVVECQYLILIQKMKEAGYVHYEISNFAKTGFVSQHNSNYWNGKKYLGVGPSAHSFDGDKIRHWNIKKIDDYCHAIAQNLSPVLSSETLSETDRYNEYIMLNMRRKEGVSLLEIAHRFGSDVATFFNRQIQPYIIYDQVIKHKHSVHLNETAFLISDAIIADLFR
jgi:oxygen-independent coproporphyrinogen-3 oxidase